MNFINYRYLSFEFEKLQHYLLESLTNHYLKSNLKNVLFWWLFLINCLNFILNYFPQLQIITYLLSLWLGLSLGLVLCKYTVAEYIYYRLFSIDLSNIDNWGEDSIVWDSIVPFFLYKKNYDHFQLKIGNFINVPSFNDCDKLYFLNPISQTNLRVCLEAYHQILNNRTTFVYNLTPFESEILGINTIGPNPALDGLILNNTNIGHLGNYRYWILGNILRLNITNMPYNFLDCYDRYDKITESMRHLAWIKARFDILNDDSRESEKMEKWIKVIWLFTFRSFVCKVWNTAQQIQPNPSMLPDSEGYLSYLEIFWDDFKVNNPNDILKKHLEKYQAQQYALEVEARQDQVVLADNQGNNDQADASSLMGNLNAIDDTY